MHIIVAGSVPKENNRNSAVMPKKAQYYKVVLKHRIRFKFTCVSLCVYRIHLVNILA